MFSPSIVWVAGINQVIKLGGRPLQLLSCLSGPQSMLLVYVTWWLLVAVTLSVSSSVAFVLNRLHNTALIKMLMSLRKSSKLRPRARRGAVPLVPALVGQTQVDL